MNECKWCAGIAIVENESDLVHVYTRILEKQGIPVCFVSYDGSDAIFKFIACTKKPHIIIMDYRLPLMNGIEVTRKIMEIDPDSKVIFLSADPGVREEAMHAGAFTYIKKPASIKEVTDAIDSVISSSSVH